MDSIQERQLNQAAFRRLSEVIRKTYAPGTYLAIAGGQIIASAAGFDELNGVLHKMGNQSADVLVVQAGTDYPETATIFCDRVRV